MKFCTTINFFHKTTAAMLVFLGLCYARDEVHWLLRHSTNPPIQKTKGKSNDDLIDRQLPELLFHMEELRMLVRKYSQIIQMYYVLYLKDYDAIALSKKLPSLIVCPEEESLILSSITNDITNLTVNQNNGDMFDFRGLRLDWFRLQAYTSLVKSQLSLFEHIDLARLLDNIIFHANMVDNLEEMIVQTSDLSIFCFYNQSFEGQFHMCLEFPAQNRYIIAFPLICSHFQHCTHVLCPEERHHIRERSLSVVNLFLDEMAKEAKNIITTTCDEQCKLSDQLLPKHCAILISQVIAKRRKEKFKKYGFEIEKPGIETYRKTREILTTMDKLHMALTELSYALNYCLNITVWDYNFSPREYLNQHLEIRFSRAIVGMAMYNPDTAEIAKPTELLASVQAYMHVLQSVENYVYIDITRIFNNVLLQQTQQVDSHGERTIASLYTEWYTEVLLRRISVGGICFSMNQRTFISLTMEEGVPISAEEYSDANELRALANLIGPYGLKLINDTLTSHIVNQIIELKKLTNSNKENLIKLRSAFGKSDAMKEYIKKIQVIDIDNVLRRMTIIGVILSFRQVLNEALIEVLEERIPFMLSSIQDFRQYSNDADSKIIDEMSSAAGLKCDIDPTLVREIRTIKNEKEDDEHLISMLMLVFVAVSIPKLASIDASLFKATLDGHVNNIHCLAYAINQIFGSLFTVMNKGDVEDRMKELLAITSSCLLILGEESDKELIKNRESIYLLLQQIVHESPFLNVDLLESCFPYALIRNAYHDVYKMESSHFSVLKS